MPFQPKNNANPKGAPKGTQRKAKLLRDMLAKYVPDAVNVVADALGAADIDDRKWAASEVLNRVYGKSPQAIELKDEDGNDVQWMFNISLKSEK